MTGRPPSLTLMVLVDALRSDYVTRMPYLRSLASRSAVGRLRECFGFVPRAAYFGGLNAAQFGFTNMLCFDLAASNAAASLRGHAGHQFQFLPNLNRGTLAKGAPDQQGIWDVKFDHVTSKALLLQPPAELVFHLFVWENQRAHNPAEETNPIVRSLNAA